MANQTIQLKIGADVLDAVRSFSDLEKSVAQSAAEFESSKLAADALASAWHTSRKAADEMRVHVALGKAELDRLGQSISKRSPEYLALQQDIKAMQGELRKSDQEAASARRSYESAAFGVERLGEAMAARQAQFAKSGESLREAGVDIHNLGTEYARLQQQLRRQGGVDVARKLLGTRGFAEIQAEIRQVHAALQTLKSSGTASMAEIERATEQARKRMDALRREMGGGARDHLADARQVLGMRSFAEIEAEIQRVRAALVTLRSSGTASMAEIDRATDRARQRIAALTREMRGDHARGMREGMESVSRQLETIRTQAAAIFAVGIGVQWARSFIGVMDAGKRLQGQLRTVAKEGENVADTQKRLIAVSNDTRMDISATTALYVRSQRALADYNLTQQQSIAFVGAFSKSLKINGASAEESASSLYQLSQALQKGTLNGDEFRTVTEAAPLLLDALARETGKSKEELFDLAAQGKLTSEVIVKAVLNMAGEWDRQFAKVPRTAADAMTQVRNDIVQAFSDIDNTQLLYAIDEIRADLSDPKTLASITTFAQAFVDAFKVAGDVLAELRGHGEEVLALVSAAAGARMGMAVGGVPGALVGGGVGLLLSPRLGPPKNEIDQMLAGGQRLSAASAGGIRALRPENLQSSLETLRNSPAPGKMEIEIKANSALANLLDTSNIGNAKTRTNALLDAAAAKYSVPPELVHALAQVESSKRQFYASGAKKGRIVSSGEAYGTMQLTPATAKAYGVDYRDEGQNIDGGVRYLSDLIKKYGDLKKAVAAYNTGEPEFDKRGLSNLLPETKDYVEKISKELEKTDLAKPFGSIDAYRAALSERETAFAASQNHNLAVAESAQTQMRAVLETQQVALDVEMEGRRSQRAAALVGVYGDDRHRLEIEQASQTAADAEEYARRKLEIDRQLLTSEQSVAQAKLKSLQAEQASAGEFEKSGVDRLALSDRIRQAETELTVIEQRRGQLEMKASQDIQEAMQKEQTAKSQAIQQEATRLQDAIQQQISLTDAIAERIRVESETNYTGQAEARETLATAYRDSAAAIDENVRALERLAAADPGNTRLQTQAISARTQQTRLQQSSEGGGSQVGNLLKQWGDVGAQIDQASVQWMTSFSDNLAEMVMTGKANFKDLAKSIVADLVTITIRSMIARAAMSFLGGVFGGASGGNSFTKLAPYSDSASSSAADVASIFHSGGVAGAASATRAVHSSVFGSAPRFHSGGMPGIKADEIAAIVQRGEGIFTQEQMRALAPMTDIAQAVESVAQRMALRSVVHLPTMQAQKPVSIPDFRAPESPRYLMPNLRAERPDLLRAESSDGSRPAWNAAGGSNGSIIQIIDQRKAGSPDIEPQRERDPNGMERIRILIREEVKNMYNTGHLDKTMRANYGVSRSGVTR